MNRKIISYYIASLVVLLTSGLTAANTSKARIASETGITGEQHIASYTRLSR